MKGERVKISQCMIVKNEEHNMERALSWGRGIVSEQIVVDTGSTDRTVEIARQMGARVYEFPWVDDFAAAKNYAVSKARYDWIAFLDADEYMSFEDGTKALEYMNMLQDTEAESLVTAWANLDDEGNLMTVGTQSRFFKRHLRYRGRIHEHLVSDGGRRPEGADVTDDVTIYHRGYGKQAEGRKKGRNVRLILLELKDHPDDYEMWGYLGQEYTASGELGQAEEAFRKAVSLMPEEAKGDYNVTTSTAALRLLQVVIAMGKEEVAVVEAYEQAVRNWPKEADYDYILGKYFVSRGDWMQGIKHLRQAIEILEAYGTACRSMILSGEIRLAYELAAVCCYNNGDMEGAAQYAAVLLKEEPYRMSTLTVLLKAFRKDMRAAGEGEKGAEKVAALLGKNFYDFSSLKDRLFVFQSALKAEYGELYAVIRRMFTPEELEAVERRQNGSR